ncbi:CGNR zinc finger domain-containing protein [Microbacterium sp. W4I20]|uniref:CGNR zinc finger domain-containing protein n=1 Tax=Microbacterium sp. W4I20 TaxID=3042262 RepID=UPI00277F047F|nr:CGNR zinc finger domain-containing protein [Microbacterium sp. W4I20]MDQ0727075.1 putative RNA-binding Zn ribbon-like protein [Microbacterium sp. W4I20]
MTSEPRATFSRIGGHVALDLINTVEWRLSDERREEDLRDYADVVRWARQLELISVDEAETLSRPAVQASADAEQELARILSIREALYSTLFAAGFSQPVAEEYREAIGHADLERHDDDWSWTLPLDLSLPRRRIALAAVDLLTHSDLSHLSQCQDAECGWVFLDTSPRSNRRWCVSSDCGNRNRVREYYARSRTARAAETA